MFVYSKKIIQFVHEIQSTVKSILSREAQLKVAGDRFYDRRQETSYPIKIVVYNNKSMLGYFDSDFYELGFNECLMQTSQEQLQNVIRHELAHYIAFINYGNTIQAHAAEFREVCRRMGWGEKIYKATTCLNDGQAAAVVEESSILRKVQKLMALASSSNKFEAEQAMIKSQQLLLMHNLESKYMGEEKDEKIFLKRILRQTKENAKMRAIARILETFFVTCVFLRAQGFICLEILGDAVNIEIAEHVASILDRELDTLWKQAQKFAHLKGAIAKNSFFLGIAKGYCNKIQALKREYNTEVTNALMVIEKKLIDAKAMVYQRLSSSRSHASYCGEARALGEQMGRQLNINSAISKSKNSEMLIGYSG